MLAQTRVLLCLLLFFCCARTGVRGAMGVEHYTNLPTLELGSQRFNRGLVERISLTSPDDPEFRGLQYSFDSATVLRCDGGAALVGIDAPVSISVGQSWTLRVIACNQAGLASEVVTAVYTYDVAPPATPLFLVGSKRFRDTFDEMVVHASPTPDFLEFRYTMESSAALDCTSGTSASEGEPISIVAGADAGIYAISCDDLGNASETAVARYTFDNVAPDVPVVSKSDGPFSISFEVKVDPPIDDGAVELRYTLDGSPLTSCSEGAAVPADGLIEIRAGTDVTLHLIACDEVGNASVNVVATYLYVYAPVFLEDVTVREPDGTYHFGDSVTIDVRFTDFVRLAAGNDTPGLLLEMSPAPREAFYLEGDGTPILTFIYEIQPGDSDSKLDYLGTLSFDLKGGTLRDPGEVEIDPILPAPGALGSISFIRQIVIDASVLEPSILCATMAGEELYNALGAGTVMDPYIVCTPEQLFSLAAANEAWSGHFRLGGDIVLLGSGAMPPIGTPAEPFTGVFDGAGYMIMHLAQSTDTSKSGFIGVLGVPGIVRNLGLTNLRMQGQSAVGGLVGSNLGTIRRCFTTGVVEATGDVAGGLVGDNDGGTIEASYSTADVTAAEFAGALVGKNTLGSIIESFSAGHATAQSFAGGIAGDWVDGLLDRSFSTSDVTARGMGAGGFFGMADGGSVMKSFSASLVSGASEAGLAVGSEVSAPTFSNSFVDTDAATSMTVVGSRVGVITGLTGVVTTLLKDSSYLSATGWDMKDTWRIDSVHGAYPQLTWEQTSEYCRAHRDVTQFFDSGDGTLSDPYLLCRAPQLRDVARDACKGMVNPSYHESKECRQSFMLMDHIDLRGEDWSGIGQSNGGDQYKGTFFGNHYTIKNMRIRAGDKQGLFRALDGNVFDLGLADVDIIGGDSVGAIAGYSPWGQRIRIENCWATGRISGVSWVGGLVGDFEKGDIVNSWTHMAVEGSDKQIGGLVGGMHDRGGNATITGSYALGSVVGGRWVGGLVGYADPVAVISSSYATGSVRGTTYIGGLIGVHSGTVENSYSTGYVTATGGKGGFAGGSNGVISNCFWNTETSTLTDAYDASGGSIAGVVEGVTSADMDGGAFLATLNATDSGWVSPATLSSSFTGPPIFDWQDSLPHSAYCWSGSKMSTRAYDALGLSPIRICSPDQWADFATAGAADWDKAVSIENAMNLGNHPDVIVGTTATPFTGSLEGQGYELSFLRTNLSGLDDVGFMGSVNGGPIRNIRLTNVQVVGGARVGGLAGKVAFTDVERCSVTGVVQGATAVGGVVGDSSLGFVRDCSANIDVTGDSIVGGLVGRLADGGIERSYATGVVNGLASPSGGIVGAAPIASVSACFSATERAGATDSLAGLAGGSVTNAYFDNTQICSACSNLTGTGEPDGASLRFAKHPLYRVGSWDFSTVWHENGAGYPVLR